MSLFAPCTEVPSAADVSRMYRGIGISDIQFSVFPPDGDSHAHQICGVGGDWYCNEGYNEVIKSFYFGKDNMTCEPVVSAPVPVVLDSATVHPAHAELSWAIIGWVLLFGILVAALLRIIKFKTKIMSVSSSTSEKLSTRFSLMVKKIAGLSDRTKAIICAALLIGFAFYWFAYRPAAARSYCSKRGADTTYAFNQCMQQRGVKP